MQPINLTVFITLYAKSLVIRLVLQFLLFEIQSVGRAHSCPEQRSQISGFFDIWTFYQIPWTSNTHNYTKSTFRTLINVTIKLISSYEVIPKGSAQSEESIQTPKLI